MAGSAPTKTENAKQQAYWSSAPGLKWIDHEAQLDLLMQSVNDRLVEKSAPGQNDLMLDIGCGTGSTAMDFARMLGPRGRVIANDISAPLLQRAQIRAEKLGLSSVEFLLADAQTHSFEPGTIDLVASRFGGMFFADPIAAYANIWRGMKPGGRLCIACWGPMNGSPWFEVPRNAAVNRLGEPAPGKKNTPGPLGLSDQEYAVDILNGAGFQDVLAEAETVILDFPVDLHAAATLAANVGPAMRILQEFGGSAADIDAIIAATAEGLAEYVVPGGLKIPAKLIFYSASKGQD